MNRKLSFILLIIIISISILFIGGEFIVRVLTNPKEPIKYDERNTIFRYDKELGWYPKENSKGIHDATRTIQVLHNKHGFRDKEFEIDKKKKIAFIGDSFVWGYDVEQNERFSDKLQMLLPEYEILNLGISGYGTDQEYILLQKWINTFKPDIVFLVFSKNDWEDNITNCRYGGYYKPYFSNSNNKIELKGTPVPKGRNYYLKEYPKLFKSQFLQKILELSLPRKSFYSDPTQLLLDKFQKLTFESGAKFILAFADCSIEEAKAKIHNLNDFITIGLQNDHVYPSNGNHWTPEGHDTVCKIIYDYLKTFELKKTDRYYPK